MEMDSNVEKCFWDSLALFDKANIVLPKRARVYIYHHTGKQRIFDVGATFVNVVNRDFCKSYVIMLPNQRYPLHYHRIKSESFYVLSGELIVDVEREGFSLMPGELFNIERGQDHSFSTKTGVIFEEISTKYVMNDSVYLDHTIRESDYSIRRTVISEKEWMEVIKRWKK